MSGGSRNSCFMKGEHMFGDSNEKKPFDGILIANIKIRSDGEADGEGSSLNSSCSSVSDLDDFDEHQYLPSTSRKPPMTYVSEREQLISKEMDAHEISLILRKLKLNRFSYQETGTGSSLNSLRHSCPSSGISEASTSHQILISEPKHHSSPMPCINRSHLEASNDSPDTKAVEQVESTDMSNIVKSKPPSTNPFQLLFFILAQNGCERTTQVSASDVPHDFFLKMTDTNLNAYTNEMLGAVRNQDISALHEYYKAGSCLQCCNKFGESILHLACRRGFTEVVRFLVYQANVSIRVRDDYGRTPMHDACWGTTPKFDLMDILISTCPDLLLISDVRNFTPLHYIRKEHRSEWCEFLWEKRDKIRITPLVKPSVSR